MSSQRKFPDAMAYWSAVRPRIADFVERNRSSQMEDCIDHTLAVYSYVQENLSDEATLHNEVLKKTGILIVLMQDALRGLYGAQRELSPVGVACLTRNILETQCNLFFIYKSDDPAKWADRFFRFAGVEKVLHEQHRTGGGAPVVSSAEVEQIRRSSPEWFDAKGKVKVAHWTAEDEWKRLKNLAKHVGLEREYHQLYGIGSKFMHGSPLLVNLYSNASGIGALANMQVSTQLSSLATKLAMDTLRATAEFYGAPSFEVDREVWQRKWLKFYTDEFEHE